MATYGTDLNVVNAADNNTNWAELSGHTSGGAPSADSENYLHNSNSVSQSTGQATGTNAGMQYDAQATVGSPWTSGHVFLFWQYYTAPTNLQTWANGGMRVGVGSSSGNMRYWNAMGDDFSGSPYACWQNTAIDPEVTGDGTDDGTPTAGVYQVFGSLPNVRAKITKGSPHAVDVIRYGRGEIRGTGTGATFDGYATDNDNATTGRWGLFQAVRGGYLWKGLFSLGQSGTSITFSDSNKSIFIDDTPRVAAGFNKIEINNTGSSVTWNGISITGVGTSITGSAPISPGDFEVVDNATTVDLLGCTFTDMGTFIFKSNSDVTGTTFRRTKQITANDATFVDAVIDSSTVAANTSALVWADPSTTDPNIYLDGASFTMGAADSHAIEFGTAVAAGTLSFTLTDVTFSGYNTTTNNQNNSTLHVKYTSGTVTINIVGTGTSSSNITYRSDGATVVVQSSINITFSGLPTGCIARLYLGSPNSSTSATLEASEDNITDGTFVATTSNGGSTAYAVFMTLNQEYKLLDFPSSSLPTASTTIPVSFGPDRVYST